jgi:F-box interacting protein
MNPESDFGDEIINSCRGFIFLHLVKSLCLWNPSTGVYRKIPLSPFNSRCSFRTHYVYLHGFGYDPLRDDYLIISVSYNHRIECVTRDNYSCFEFFSLRENTWKEIKGTKLNMICNSGKYGYPKAGLLFNVAIHWIDFHDKMPHFVIAFDLVERKLVQIPFPDGFFDEETKLFHFDVWVFGECLSLWSVDHGGKVKIWVMKEYKVHSSWTKALVFYTDYIPYRQLIFSLICSTKSGDIIAKYRDGLLKYNNEGQLLECEPFFDGLFEIGSYIQATVYTKSLFSLPDANVQGVEDDTKIAVLKYSPAPFT